MKKLLFILLLFSSGIVTAQNSKTSPYGGGTENPKCPPGMCPTVNIFLEMFNFHKPRTNCSNGFGLCIKFSTSVTCEYCFGKSNILGDKISVYTTLDDNYATLHFPMSLKYEKEFEGADFNTFEIEDQSLSFKQENGKEVFVKGGLYPVSIVDDEMIVTLHL